MMVINKVVVMAVANLNAVCALQAAASNVHQKRLKVVPDQHDLLLAKIGKQMRKRRRQEDMDHSALKKKPHVQPAALPAAMPEDARNVTGADSSGALVGSAQENISDEIFWAGLGELGEVDCQNLSDQMSGVSDNGANPSGALVKTANDDIVDIDADEIDWDEIYLRMALMSD